MRIDLTSGNDLYEQKYEDRDQWNDIWGGAGNDIIRLYQGMVHAGPGNDIIERLKDPNNPYRRLEYASDGFPAQARWPLA